MQKPNISDAVIRRMPKYFRYLDELVRQDMERISSKSLAEKMGLTASQIRQDLNCFGEFGQQGYGYNVKVLRDEIAKILGINQSSTAILIGVGNLGKALIHNFSFDKRGFSLIGAFDNNPALIGTTIKNTPVFDIATLPDFCKKHNPDVGVLTLPKDEAPGICRILVDHGIKGIWNFANMDIKIDAPGVCIENVHFSDSLMTLCYKITQTL